MSWLDPISGGTYRMSERGDPDYRVFADYPPTERHGREETSELSSRHEPCNVHHHHHPGDDHSSNHYLSSTPAHLAQGWFIDLIDYSVNNNMNLLNDNIFPLNSESIL